MEPMVCISTRIEELKEEREKVREGINELWNQEDIPFKVWDWENANEIPSGKNPDWIQSKGIENSDIYVLILGSEYGDYKYGESPTHKEYKDACSEIEKDCILIYIKEVKDREEKVDRWIKEIKENEHTYKPFKNPDDLKNKVKDRLRNLWNKRKWEHADGKLPDIRVKINLMMASDGRNFLGLEARNHDKNSIISELSKNYDTEQYGLLSNYSRFRASVTCPNRRAEVWRLNNCLYQSK